MPDVLFHPPHVQAGINRIDACTTDDEVRKALVDPNPRSSGHIPDGSIVRLLRRCRVEQDRKREDLLFDVLARRIIWFARSRYSGLSGTDQQDLAQALAERIIRDLAKTDVIDYWEISFTKCRDRAAADVYWDIVGDHRDRHVDIDDEADRLGDEGFLSAGMIEEIVATSFAKKVLSEDEQAAFYLMFVSGLPVKSARGSVDVVRLLDKPEGTIREMKTNIKRKLMAAKKEQSQ